MGFVATRPALTIFRKRGEMNEMVLNIDRNTITNPCMADFGGLARRNDGCFVFYFHVNVGLSNILHAKI